MTTTVTAFPMTQTMFLGLRVGTAILAGGAADSADALAAGDTTKHVAITSNNRFARPYQCAVSVPADSVIRSVRPVVVARHSIAGAGLSARVIAWTDDAVNGDEPLSTAPAPSVSTIPGGDTMVRYVEPFATSTEDGVAWSTFPPANIGVLVEADGPNLFGLDLVAVYLEVEFVTTAAVVVDATNDVPRSELEHAFPLLAWSTPEDAPPQVGFRVLIKTGLSNGVPPDGFGHDPDDVVYDSGLVSDSLARQFRVPIPVGPSGTTYRPWMQLWTDREVEPGWAVATESGGAIDLAFDEITMQGPNAIPDAQANVQFAADVLEGGNPKLEAAFNDLRVQLRRRRTGTTDPWEVVHAYTDELPASLLNMFGGSTVFVYDPAPPVVYPTDYELGVADFPQHVSSAPVTAFSPAPTQKCWWLRSAEDPTAAMTVDVTAFTPSTPTPSLIVDPLPSSEPGKAVVATNVGLTDRLAVTFRTLDEAAYTGLLGLLNSDSVLVLQDPLDRSWRVRVADARTRSLVPARPTADEVADRDAEIRHLHAVSVQFVSVDV